MHFKDRMAMIGYVNAAEIKGATSAARLRRLADAKKIPSPLNEHPDGIDYWHKEKVERYLASESEVPDGFETSAVAADRLNLGRSTVSVWCDRGKVHGAIKRLVDGSFCWCAPPASFDKVAEGIEDRRRHVAAANKARHAGPDSAAPETRLTDVEYEPDPEVVRKIDEIHAMLVKLTSALGA